MALRYITLDDLVAEIPLDLQGVTSDDVANSETRVDSVVTQQAESAEEEVESYLSSRYVIPLKATDGTVPNSVKNSIYVITKYNLYRRRDMIPDVVFSSYENIIDWLEKVRDGLANVNLILADGSVQSQGGQQIEVSVETQSQFNNFF